MILSIDMVAGKLRQSFDIERLKQFLISFNLENDCSADTGDSWYVLHPEHSS